MPSVNWKSVEKAFASLGSTYEKNKLVLVEYISCETIEIYCPSGMRYKFDKNTTITNVHLQDLEYLLENVWHLHIVDEDDLPYKPSAEWVKKDIKIDCVNTLQQNFTHYCGYCGNFFHPDYVSCICCGGRAQERILIADYDKDKYCLDGIKEKDKYIFGGFFDLEVQKRLSNESLRFANS